ncbi:MAG: hypothetical protein PHY45_05855 [Rhodocyclaceae bacterium]|nr:hypothetical protein [Rhodocyclaceae bacterium]
MQHVGQRIQGIRPGQPSQADRVPACDARYDRFFLALPRSNAPMTKAATMPKGMKIAINAKMK